MVLYYSKANNLQITWKHVQLSNIKRAAKTPPKIQVLMFMTSVTTRLCGRAVTRNL